MRRHKYVKLDSGACVCKQLHDAEPGTLVGTWPIFKKTSFDSVTRLWFERDPDVKILVFENRALDSSRLGDLIFVPWWTSDEEKEPLPLKVGDRLPDSWASGGIGWAYLLQEIVTDPGLFHLEDQ